MFQTNNFGSTSVCICSFESFTDPNDAVALPQRRIQVKGVEWQVQIHNFGSTYVCICSFWKIFWPRSCCITSSASQQTVPGVCAPVSISRGGVVSKSRGGARFTRSVRHVHCGDDGLKWGSLGPFWHRELSVISRRNQSMKPSDFSESHSSAKSTIWITS